MPIDPDFQKNRKMAYQQMKAMTFGGHMCHHKNRVCTEQTWLLTGTSVQETPFASTYARQTSSI